MKIAVCVKQVPVVSMLKFDSETKRVVRDGVPNEVNPFDILGMSAAAGIRKATRCEVVVVTLGPPQAREALVQCLALGADRAIHLVDPAFAGSDTLATARAALHGAEAGGSRPDHLRPKQRRRGDQPGRTRGRGDAGHGPSHQRQRAGAERLDILHHGSADDGRRGAARPLRPARPRHRHRGDSPGGLPVEGGTWMRLDRFR